MNIDNAITRERVKKAITPRVIAIALIITLLFSAVFYITLERLDRDEILIWLVTDNIDDGPRSETLALINDYGLECGFDRIILTRRDPRDFYFDATMSTRAYYTCDIFIMKSYVAEKYADMDIFLPITMNLAGMLYINEISVGIPLYDDYYALINKNSKVNTKVIYDIIDILEEK